MQRLKRFWPAIESVPGPAAVVSEWRRLLGPEYDLVQTWLRPRHDLATSVPCPQYPGAVHRIVDHGDGHYVAVCPEGCPKQTLTKADLVVYGLDPMALMVAITKAFDLSLQFDQSNSLSHVERIATYVPTMGFRFPVYLAIATQGKEMVTAVRAVMAGCKGPFILLAPTRQLWTSECQKLLEGKNAVFLTLAETMALDDQGHMVLMQPRDELLATFHDAVLPAKDAQDGLALFMTPEGAAWRDVRISFKDNHTVAVDVLGVKGTYHYRQMGMADGRNGEPNKQWELLYAFANEDGRLDWKSPHADRRNQKRREMLAQTLRDFFRLGGDPIESIGNGWQTQFAVSLTG